MTDTAPGSPADATRLLPEDGVYSLDAYLAMQGALGHRLRFRAVRALAAAERSPAALADALDVAPNTLHYHLGVLVDVGLIERRRGVRPDDDGPHAVYRSTPMAAVLLADGVEALLRAEREFLETYGG